MKHSPITKAACLFFWIFIGAIATIFFSLFAELGIHYLLWSFA